ncbi:unnamed protein product, partial [Vitis vinifera]|uniref:Uncharacterized protein n=1 Tax=Vitis vinifera TaxID=29760 RepID=D7SX56_VITVI
MSLTIKTIDNVTNFTQCQPYHFNDLIKHERVRLQI